MQNQRIPHAPVSGWDFFFLFFTYNYELQGITIVF